MTADGRNVVRLSDGSMVVSSFSWSPDGRRIAFGATRDDEWDIYVVNASGDGLARLTDGYGQNCSPAWSPDGRRIAFMSDRDGDWGDWRLFVMNSDGSGAVRLADVEASAYPPRWSPDGERIAFMAWHGNFEICVVDADGSDLSRLTTSQWSMASPPPVSAWSVEPDWSPDGEHIVFMGYRDDRPSSQIYVISANGGDPTMLTGEHPRNNMRPAWSPDGRRIAFTSHNGDGAALCVMNVDGSDRVELTRIAEADIYLDWSPDGRQIAFESGDDDNTDIYVIDADGSNMRRLTSNEARNVFPAWSP